MAKNGQNAKAIADAKYSVWVKKYNFLKHARNFFTNTLKLFYAKNGSKKQLILEKWEHFENGRKWPPSKGYRLCKIVTLAQKLKMHKNMLKTFLQHIAVVLCKKRLEKTANFGKMRAFWKWPKMATKQNRHFGSKIKNA